MKPIETLKDESARRRAQAAADKRAGAIASSRIGDRSTGEFGDVVVLEIWAEVDLALLLD